MLKQQLNMWFYWFQIPTYVYYVLLSPKIGMYSGLELMEQNKIKCMCIVCNIANVSDVKHSIFIYVYYKTPRSKVNKKYVRIF